jgi:hypothetical protein
VIPSTEGKTSLRIFKIKVSTTSLEEAEVEDDTTRWRYYGGRAKTKSLERCTICKSGIAITIPPGVSIE